MNNCILKYTLNGYGQTVLPLPWGSQVIHFDLQQGMFTIWALVPEIKKGEVPRHFHVFHTGDFVPEGLAHLGTAMTNDGSYVVHLFEKVNP